MKNSSRLLASALTGMVLVALGCSSSDEPGGSTSAMNNPFRKYTKEEQLAAAAARSYKEVKRENVIYVVSSPDALRRVNAGDEPAMKVSAIGFGPNGEKVIFEASKDGLENGLMAEFERRHHHATTTAAARS
jgi:hypothetical protein